LKDKEFGDRVALLRKEDGLTQKETAKSIGVSYSAYQRYESGGLPSQNNIQKILDYFKCTRAWLLTGGNRYSSADIDKKSFPFEISTVQRTESNYLDLELMTFVFKEIDQLDKRLVSKNLKISGDIKVEIIMLLYHGLVNK
jgi:transcriptional regulator with XRE-family HTH domain